MATKREAPNDDSSDDSSKPLCKWGPLCYRKNPDHLREFSHPHRVGKASPGDNNNKANKPPPAKAPRPPAFPSTESSVRKLALASTESKTPPKPKHSDAAYLESCYDLLVCVASYRNKSRLLNVEIIINYFSLG